METMGKKGLQEVAVQNAQKAAYAAKRISEVDGYSIRFSAPHFNEFVVRGPRPAVKILGRLLKDNGNIGGLALAKYYDGHENDFLVAVTELNTKNQIDQLAAAL
jgi:glycine dehydrogenase subunit 1